MKNIKATAIQMDISQCNKQENISKALMLSEEAISQGANLIVLPEVFSTGFCYEDLENAGESQPWPTIKLLKEFSKKNNCIMIGSIIQKIEQEETTIYTNLSFCIENGKLAGTYNKTHPFEKENGYFTPGNSIEPIYLKSYDITIGLEICYEMRFPEIARKLSIAGSDLLVTIAEFPNPREYQWRALATARAIENQIYHIACNRIGSDPNSTFFGATMIIDPLGNVLDDAEDKECFIIRDIDPEMMESTRKAIPIFKDRRPDLY
ncbi:MAG: carbon-nitrogen family hydrolase [Halobacteriota archaeon]